MNNQLQEQYMYANLALQSACPGNEILVDENGIPSVMVKIPKMTFRELGMGNSDDIHPAFTVNGRELDYIYVSKYGNILTNGIAHSMPGVDPAAEITFDDAAAACRAKGKGWHLMTKAEFAVIALWCAKQGFLPWGNNDNGHDFREDSVTAIRFPSGHTAAGTGPLNWYHNRSLAGIADLNGNTSNWMGGIRMFHGELQVIQNAADSKLSQAADSPEWKAIDGTDGSLIEPDGLGTTKNSVKLDFKDNTGKNTGNCGWLWISGLQKNKADTKRASEFAGVQADSTLCPKVILWLQALALLPYSKNPNTYGHCKMYADNDGGDVRYHCGGSYHDGCDAGVFWNRSIGAIDHGSKGIGFRCAYVEL